MTALSGATLRSAPAFPGSPPAAPTVAPTAAQALAGAPDPVLALDRIGLTFGGVTALDGVGVTVAPGRSAPSSGRTTRGKALS